MKQLRIYSLVVRILVVLAGVLATTRASAQPNDLFTAAYNGDLPQIERILEINALQEVTKAVVEAARESLVIGQV